MALVSPKSYRRRRGRSMLHYLHRRESRFLLLFVLTLVLVFAEPVSSLRGPEEVWLSPGMIERHYLSRGHGRGRCGYLDKSHLHFDPGVAKDRFGKTASVLYGSNSSSSLPLRLMTVNISHPFSTTSGPLSPLHPSPHTPKHHPHPLPSPVNLRAHDSPTSSKDPPPRTKPTARPELIGAGPAGVKDLEEENAGGGNTVLRTTIKGTKVTPTEDRHALPSRSGQATTKVLRVRTRPQHIRREAVGKRKRKEKGRPRKRVDRRKAAYPRGHLTDGYRRSLIPGPPYDHYRRMVHVSSGAPTTLSPTLPTRHTLPLSPMLPAKPSHSINGLSRSNESPPSSPTHVPFFREDLSPGPPLYLSPPISPPRPYQLPSPRPYQLPNPRPLRLPPPPTPPSFAISSVLTSPPPLPSIPFPTLPSHATSPSPKLKFFRLPARPRKPNSQSSNSYRRPGVSSLGRSSTPRPLVQPPTPTPPPAPAPPVPVPTSPPPPAPIRDLSLPPPTRSSELKVKQRQHDFPTYASVPKTSFTCRATPHPGLYGDVETRCQAWHVCEADGRQHSFLCPNGTVFSQRLLTCDWWYNVHCGSDKDSHLTTIYDTGLRERYNNPGKVYGKKMTHKPIKPYSPNYKAPVTPVGRSESPRSPSTNLNQNQQGHSPLPRLRIINSHFGVFPRYQLRGKFKTLWLREMRK